MTVIASNTSALRAQNASNTANKGLSQAMERLSSGKRINSAKDDAAGLAIVTKMNAEVRGMTAARRNANDGISLAQTAEGALGDVSNMLTRMKELAVQATNGTNGTEAKANIQKEVDALVTQIGEVGKMKFNGVDLFSATATKIQTGTGASDQVSITTGALTTTGLGIATLDVSTTASFAAIDDAISKVSTSRADMGAVQSRLDSAASNLTSTITNLSDAASRIQDADFSEESTALAKNQILTQASTAMLAQANQSQQGVLSLLR